MASKRIRRIGSIKAELIKKSRESALAAIQVFNNPLIEFKSESFIVLMIISWTYLLHAYYRGQGVEYRYFSWNNGRKSFDKTKSGAHKYWELERCLNDARCPLDQHTKNNLRFLIGLRHEVEHQMSLNLDHFLSGRYQACALNYCLYVAQLFGKSQAIDQHLAYSIQFSAVLKDQVFGARGPDSLPANLKSYIAEFDDSLTDDEFKDERFAYRVLLLRKTVNRKGQADSVIEFVDPNSEFAKSVDKLYLAAKDRERPKFLPGSICKIMQAEGYPKFKIYNHTVLWKKNGGKNPAKGYGVPLEGNWYWYENWLEIVRKHCRDAGELYK